MESWSCSKEAEAKKLIRIKDKSKKISDYFTDCKFDLLEKENQWILESDGQIIWIVGKRNDERFKVSDHTNNVLMIEWVE